MIFLSSFMKNILGTQIKTICNQNNLIEYYFKNILDFCDTVNFVSGWSLIMANNGYQNSFSYQSYTIFLFEASDAVSESNGDIISHIVTEWGSLGKLTIGLVNILDKSCACDYKRPNNHVFS